MCQNVPASALVLAEGNGVHFWQVTLHNRLLLRGPGTLSLTISQY